MTARQKRYSTTTVRKRSVDMREAVIEMAARKESALSTPIRLKNGTAEDAVADFAERFCFNDWGIELEFTDKERLRDFFQKERELCPDSSFHLKTILSSEDHVIAQWILKYSIKEPFFGGVLRNVPIALQGVSVIRRNNGKIVEWADYYDGLTSRRTALASYFTDWIEY
jgi:ketosteroid isomerase-like protein